MVGFTSELGESLNNHANLRSKNTAFIFGQRKKWFYNELKNPILTDLKILQNSDTFKK